MSNARDTTCPCQCLNPILKIWLISSSSFLLSLFIPFIRFFEIPLSSMNEQQHPKSKSDKIKGACVVYLGFCAQLNSMERRQRTRREIHCAVVSSYSSLIRCHLQVMNLEICFFSFMTPIHIVNHGK